MSEVAEQSPRSGQVFANIDQVFHIPFLSKLSLVIDATQCTFHAAVKANLENAASVLMTYFGGETPMMRTATEVRKQQATNRVFGLIGTGH